MKTILFCSLCAFVFIGCSAARTTVYQKFDTVEHKTAELQLPDDSWDLRSSITRRINALGFEIITSHSEVEPDFVIFADYQTYWDVVHQTFNYFDISFEDHKTGEVFVTSSYVGRFGFNGCEAALDIVFKDLSTKLSK